MEAGAVIWQTLFRRGATNASLDGVSGGAEQRSIQQRAPVLLRSGGAVRLAAGGQLNMCGTHDDRSTETHVRKYAGVRVRGG